MVRAVLRALGDSLWRSLGVALLDLYQTRPASGFTQTSTRRLFFSPGSLRADQVVYSLIVLAGVVSTDQPDAHIQSNATGYPAAIPP